MQFVSVKFPFLTKESVGDEVPLAESVGISKVIYRGPAGRPAYEVVPEVGILAPVAFVDRHIVAVDAGVIVPVGSSNVDVEFLGCISDGAEVSQVVIEPVDPRSLSPGVALKIGGNIGVTKVTFQSNGIDGTAVSFEPALKRGQFLTVYPEGGSGFLVRADAKGEVSFITDTTVRVMILNPSKVPDLKVAADQDGSAVQAQKLLGVQPFSPNRPKPSTKKQTL